MAKRSTQITVQNNTDLDLTLIAADLCHGCWTNNASPPSTIAKHSSAGWEAESCGILTGTEGWAKYQVTNLGNCVPELAYIYWDNSFVWANDTQAIYFSVTTTDVKPPCDGDKGSWDTSGGFPHGGTNPPECTHELFGVAAGGGGITGVSWWDVAVAWPALLGLTVLGQADINLQFTVGLRLKGSLGETVGSQSILAIARAKRQPSLRKLFHM